MIVVADASPLIFLDKIRRLALIHRVFAGEVHVPTIVRDEVVGPAAAAEETPELESFLRRCRIEAVPRPRHFAGSISRADAAALTLALRRKAEFLLCDDRVLRRLAETQGVRPMGTLGILLRAMQRRHQTPRETREAVDLLVRRHNFRIGVEVYQRVIEAIEGS
jgi:hypothetical protein